MNALRIEDFDDFDPRDCSETALDLTGDDAGHYEDPAFRDYVLGLDL